MENMLNLWLVSWVLFLQNRNQSKLFLFIHFYPGLSAQTLPAPASGAETSEIKICIFSGLRYVVPIILQNSSLMWCGNLACYFWHQMRHTNRKPKKPLAAAEFGSTFHGLRKAVFLCLSYQWKGVSHCSYKSANATHLQIQSAAFIVLLSPNDYVSELSGIAHAIR